MKHATILLGVLAGGCFSQTPAISSPGSIGLAVVSPSFAGVPELLGFGEETNESQADLFGSSICSLGDVNKDGVPDCAIGAPLEGLGGTVRVFSGIDGGVLYKLSSGLPRAQFGFSIAACEDIDADEILDMIVGAPHEGEPSGYVSLFSGLNGELIWKADGEHNETWFGQVVASAGDVNRDGLDDIVLGTRSGGPYSTDAGHAKVLSGRDGSVIVTIRPKEEKGTFAWRVAGIGDVNGDACSDIAVGSLGRQTEVYSGTNGDLIYAVSAESVAGICAVRDLNEDGLGDWIIGHGPGIGSSLVSGAPGYVSFVSGAEGEVIRTENISGFFSICVLSDLDSDGFPDYAIGADGFPAGGSTRVLSGQTGEEIRRFEGEILYRYLGYSLSPAGDVDGDGLMDILIGACNPWTPSAPGYAQIRSVMDGSLIREYSISSSR